MKRNITLKDLAALSVEGLPLKEKDGYKLLKRSFEIIRELYVAGHIDKLTVVNFGTFYNLTMGEKRNRNPGTHKLNLIPSKRNVRLKISSSFKRNLN